MMLDLVEKHPNLFYHSFVAILEKNGVIEPRGFLDQEDGVDSIRVITENLTSSEAEAVVAAMRALLIAPIQVSGTYEARRADDDSRDESDIYVRFRSACGTREVTMEYDVYVNEALESGSDFVLAKLENNATQEERDFWEVMSQHGPYNLSRN